MTAGCSGTCPVLSQVLRWAAVLGVMVTVRAHMDVRVLGRVLFAVLWFSHHHDAGRSIMMLAAES